MPQRRSAALPVLNRRATFPRRMKSKTPRACARASLLLGYRFANRGESIVFSGDFEVALRMSAGRANLGRFRPDDDVSAVATFPDLDFALLEDRRRLDVLQ